MTAYLIGHKENELGEIHIWIKEEPTKNLRWEITVGRPSWFERHILRRKFQDKVARAFRLAEKKRNQYDDDYRRDLAETYEVNKILNTKKEG